MNYLATKKLQLRPINLARYFWGLEDGDVYDHIQAKADGVFHPYGFSYGPLRQPLEIPDMDRFRIVLMLRDPRDVLTSFYYSITISHGLPVTEAARQQFLQQRRQWEGSSIDEFVLGWLPEFQRRYEGYLRIREKTGCSLLRYEDMLADFDQWAMNFGKTMGVTLTPSDVAYLRRMGGFDQDLSEDVNRHIRQRTPGDFQRKLASGTIEQITDQLHPVLEGFGYL